MPAFKPLPTEEDNSALPTGVLVIAFIAGIIILVLGAGSVRQDYRVLHKLTHLDSDYRAVPAKWIRVAVRSDSSSEREYYPDVLFEYFVDGGSVWGWRLSLEEHARPKAYWEKRLANYHVGDAVTAYVNPADAKDSFVEKKNDGLFRYLLKGLVGIGFCLFGATLLFIPLGGWLRGLLASKSGPRG